MYKQPNYISLANSLDLCNQRTSVQKLTNTGKPMSDFLNAHMTRFKESKKRKFMITAQDYYQNENDIMKRKRTYIDRNGTRKEAENLSNSKLPHPFFRKLTNQKVNYLLSKPLSIDCENDDFVNLLEDRFDDAFHMMLKRVGKNAIINAISWVQAYYDVDGMLKFKRIPSEEVCAFWADADHTILEAVLRMYVVEELDNDGTIKLITKVEYYTPNGSWYFVETESGLVPDTTKGADGIAGHFSLQQPKVDGMTNEPIVGEDGEQQFSLVEAVWDRVPFIPFKYNDTETSLLKWIKELVDDYDINSSDTSNSLQDIPNSIKIVKNYDGTDKEEFTENLSVFRTVFVHGDGDVTSLDTKLDSTSVEAHLTRVRKDIYEAGCGVDTQEKDLGNASGVSLKFRYADLDMDASDMANEFRASLAQLIWFIKVDLLNRNEGDFMDQKFEIVFNTDITINEDEAINECVNSKGIVSEDTILANHPWVKNVAKEKELLEDQYQRDVQRIKDMQQDDEQDTGFGTQPTQTNTQEE